MEYSALLAAIPIIIIAGIILLTIRNGIDKRLTVAGILGVIVCVVLTASVLIPFCNMEGDTESFAEWQYDDYKVASNVTSASGALELVTYSDIQYLHADSVGIGTYVTGDKTITVTVSKATLDVFLVAGQSNSAYIETSDPTQCDPIPKLGTSYYFGTSEQPYVAQSYNVTTYDFSDGGMYSMTNNDGSAHIGNLDAPFSAQYYSEYHHKTYLVNAGVGSSAISSWIPGGDSFVRASAMWEKALDVIPVDSYEITVKGILWVQGEADQTNSVQHYEDNFMLMFNGMKGSSFSADHPIDVVLISETRDGYNAATAQKILARDNVGVYLATSIALTFTQENGEILSDNVHYSALGDNKLGVAFAEYCKRIWLI